MRNSLIVSAFAVCNVVLAACYATDNFVAVPNIVVGRVEADQPTLVSLGLHLPIISGDENYNAVAFVEYRGQGAINWSAGLPLLRVRPEFADIDREESFAGSIFGLQAGTSYEVRINVVDPDGADIVQTLTLATRALPAALPKRPNFINVSDASQFHTALASAEPGDVIELAAGTYVGDFVVPTGTTGTSDNPIFVRGVNRNAVILRGKGGPGLQIYGSFITLEDITIEAGESGIGVLARDSEGTVIRRTRIANVDKGIILTHGTNRNFTIYDNVLEGRNLWPVIDNSTWDDEGIAVTGEGHAIFQNTLSGFGDALGLSRFGDIPNRSIDFYRNEVLWTGDDGIELDDGERNVRAFENRVTNSATLISIQHNYDTGGPVYAFRNVGINQARMPFKLNDSPSGFYLLHNTSVKTLGADEWLWVQYNNGPVQNFQLMNNVLVSVAPWSRGILFEAPISVAEFDYNGYRPFDHDQPFERYSVSLRRAPFESAIALGPDYTTFAIPQDVTLKVSSKAIDAGIRILNINNEYRGDAPDLGAYERGFLRPVYGARW